MAIAIETGEILHGNMPRGTPNLVLDWWELHHQELLDNWQRAQASQPLTKIPPLE